MTSLGMFPWRRDGGRGGGEEILGVLTAAQEGGGHTLACLIRSLPEWTALYSQIDTLVFLGPLGSPKMQRRVEEAVCNTKQCAGRFTACSGQPFSLGGLPSTKALGSLSRFLFFLLGSRLSFSPLSLSVT